MGAGSSASLKASKRVRLPEESPLASEMLLPKAVYVRLYFLAKDFNRSISLVLVSFNELQDCMSEIESGPN